MSSIINAINRASRIVNKGLILNAINAWVVFPKADKVFTGRAIHEIQVESYRSKDIKLALERDIDASMRLHAVGAKQDVVEACEMVDEIAKTAPIDGVRFIQIHKTGVDLLRIHRTGSENMERAAFLEMNEYRRRRLEEGDRRMGSLLAAGVALSFMITGAKLHGRIEKRNTASD